MSLSPGTKLGPYEILSPLGAGGMGEVYRARDARLDRDVAIKIMPSSMADDPERRARFEREAKAVAALSHPNILAIFDTGIQDGQLFAVTELLEGDTLRARLTEGPLPTRKAVDIATQMARGLAAAHDKGLVHRDLKPENVFLLADGRVKILDFGLARQVSAGGSGATETGLAITDPGTVMGTVGYMAPEQVRGQAVDARTDLFAFGAVLYEMLAGRRAFQRDTSAETMTAILREDPPDVTASRADLSGGLDRIVRHCLEKNPAERFQTARDVAFALEAFSGTHATGVLSGAAAPVPSPSRPWWRLAVLPLVGCIGLGLGVAADRALQPAPSHITFQTKTWDSEWISNARFAPDGQTIVFSAATTGTVPRLYVVRPGSVASQPIGEPGTHLLAVSSKGELAVLTGAVAQGHRLFTGTLARMPMDGAPRPWLEHVRDADWAPDGSTLAVIRTDAGRNSIEYPIGKVLYTPPEGYVSDIRVAPDGAQVAFFEHPIFGDDRGSVKVVDATGTVRALTGDYFAEEGLAWSADSRSVLFSGSAVGAESLEPLAVNVAGRPVVRQLFAGSTSMEVMDATATGRLLVMSDQLRVTLSAKLPGEAAERELRYLDYDYLGYVSHDRKFALFGDESQSAGPNYAAAVWDFASDRVVRLGEGTAIGVSPDDKWAAAQVPSTNEMVLYPIGAGDPLKLPKGPIVGYQSGIQWLPDGRVVVCGVDRAQQDRCYAQDTHGGAPVPVTPDGVRQVLVADDGHTALARSDSRQWQLLNLGGGFLGPATGLTTSDFAIGWAHDGQSVFVAVFGKGFTAPVDRVNVRTGARTHLLDLGPPDKAGVTFVLPSQILDEGRGYVYSCFREPSRLFVVTGVQ